MSLSILAHGGQMTGDEIAIMGGGLSFALLFPIAVLIVVSRRMKKKEGSNDGDGGDASATAVAAAPEPTPSVLATPDPAERT
ncbi:hypothetical protein TUM20985_43000 [Mycobacterium antarcticum]|uniref:hypothetical protein n=1 Tax=unclassified Mycolicibacterium TaxID=2636767 RepID=UPI002396CD79|nr:MULTISPECIES: hypothetical protein [unclassified Mycolicibacterium]BDX33753.1 hypothetical protein TUM20985_43000 [Mycolicibacterium sp. TUM20985]GLP76920.1 hypothetical protein TUM20983_40300 [Mycolicibacterium sp. TUM20983]GLP82659.1 hypothetical protein TUM20984_40790 [Mycolicibacterium sp. TUM20984]